jgi:hypothetical protein
METQLLKFSSGLDSVSLEPPHSSRKRPVGRCCRQRKSLIVLPLLFLSLLLIQKKSHIDKIAIAVVEKNISLVPMVSVKHHPPTHTTQ